MKRWIAALLAAGMAGTALAQPPQDNPADRWVYVKFPGWSLAWNTTAVKWNAAGDQVEGQSLYRYAEIEVIEGKAIRWSRENWRIDCRAGTYQLVSGNELDEGMGVVFTLKPGQPMAIAKGGFDQLLKMMFCDQYIPPDMKEATGMNGAAEALRG